MWTLGLIRTLRRTRRRIFGKTALQQGAHAVAHSVPGGYLLLGFSASWLLFFHFARAKL
jgi:hypothetical protein